MKDVETDDLVDKAEACRILGGKSTPIHPSSLYRGINEGRFPKPLKHGGPGTSRWLRSELLACVRKAASARDSEAA